MVFYHSQGSLSARVKGNLDLFQSFNIHGPAANVLILNASTAESARRSPFVLLLYRNHIEIHTRIKYLPFDSLNGLFYYWCILYPRSLRIHSLFLSLTVWMVNGPSSAYSVSSHIQKERFPSDASQIFYLLSISTRERYGPSPSLSLVKLEIPYGI